MTGVRAIARLSFNFVLVLSSGHTTERRLQSVTGQLTPCVTRKISAHSHFQVSLFMSGKNTLMCRKAPGWSSVELFEQGHKESKKQPQLSNSHSLTQYFFLKLDKSLSVLISDTCAERRQEEKRTHLFYNELHFFLPDWYSLFCSGATWSFTDLPVFPHTV